MKTLFVKTALAFLAACAVVSAPGARAATLAEWPAGFVPQKQGANGWWYMYSPAREYNPSETANLMDTNTPRYYAAPKGSPSIWYIGTMNAGLDANPLLRWVSPSASAATIKGTVQSHWVSDNKDADGWTFYIRVNGREQWSKKIAKTDGASYAFEVTADLKAGDDVDFLMDREANKWYDEAIVKIQIVTRD